MVETRAVIFDYGRTLYDPVEHRLFQNTIEVLESLQDMGWVLGLVSIAETDDIEQRYQDLERLGLKPFLDEVEIIPRSTADKDFSSMVERLHAEPVDTLVVGDNLKRDMLPGIESARLQYGRMKDCLEISNQKIVYKSQT